MHEKLLDIILKLSNPTQILIMLAIIGIGLSVILELYYLFLILPLLVIVIYPVLKNIWKENKINKKELTNDEAYILYRLNEYINKYGNKIKNNIFIQTRKVEPYIEDSTGFTVIPSNIGSLEIKEQFTNEYLIKILKIFKIKGYIEFDSNTDILQCYYLTPKGIETANTLILETEI